MQRVNYKLESLYDTYIPMLYDIALQISPTKKVAEQIIISTFTKAHKQNIEQQIYPSPCITLLKLLVQTAHQQLNNNTGKTNFIIKQFQNTPMLHHIICEQITFEYYCMQNKMAKEQAMKDFRDELSLILKTVTHIPVKETELEAYNFVKLPTK